MTDATDRKLVFHVKKFFMETKTDSTKIPADNKVYDWLVNNYREYQRKPQISLKKSIDKVVNQYITESVKNRTNSNKILVSVEDNDSSKKKSKKRKLGKDKKSNNSNKSSDETDDNNVDSSEDEDVYDAEAKEFDIASASQSHNLLNSSIMNKYRKTNEEESQANTPIKKKKKKKKIRASTAPDDDELNQAMGGGGDANSSFGSLVERPTSRYSDLAGVESILQEVRELVEYPLTHPEIYAHLGVDPPRGILLHGPPGCGKTLLANSIAGELGVAFLKISAPEIVSGMSGESEQKVRQLFDAAIEAAPSIIFMDEIDAVTQKREQSQRSMEKRIVAQLLTCMDSLNLENTDGKPVVVIGATNRPDTLDSALRRAGRFDREICIGVPDEAARARILKVMSNKMTLSGDIDFLMLAKKTPGFVGADLSSVTKEAAVNAINRIFMSIVQKAQPSMPASTIDTTPETSMDVDEDKQQQELNTDTDTVAVAVVKEETNLKENKVDPDTKDVTEMLRKTPYLTPEQLQPLSVNMDDFLAAVKKVQPSSKREGFATIPDVSWNDVGALVKVREELSLSVLEPIAFPERFQNLGLSIPAGVLLFGPPGCGKTLLAKAIATESGANFISVKGPELLDKYVGESEKSVRQVFTRARASAPCIIFFDELDALCPKRGSGGEGGGNVTERVVNQLLTEMDGLEARRNVFIIAATNRPELIDPAMLRPGRLDKIMYVPLPEPEDRESILKAVTRTVSIDPSVDLHAIATSPKADGYSGADLSALVREAGLSVLRQARASGRPFAYDKIYIKMENFIDAFNNIIPSVSKKDQKAYDKMRRNLCTARSRQTTNTNNQDTNSNNESNIDEKDIKVEVDDLSSKIETV